MTGLELLQEEMLKRGAQKQQIHSKILPMVLDILSEDKTKYLETRDAESRLFQMQQEERWVKQNRDSAKREYESLKEKIAGLKREQAQYLSKERQYVNDWLEALSEMETPEDRDLMRKAQIFINTVNVDTKYDNTAFIIGLAAILTDGNVGAINELQKINKQIPVPLNDKTLGIL